MLALPSVSQSQTLNKILWADAVLGGSTGILGLAYSQKLSVLLGFSAGLIQVVSAITVGYAAVAFVLAAQLSKSSQLVRALAFANWFWTLVSLVMLATLFDQATLLGRLYLVLQPLVVGGLAYLESAQLRTR